MSEMYNGTAKIPPEKFEFVHSGERIADKKFEDKPIGYFKDAWIRFRKNHASVVATIIIICIVLFAFLTPIFNTRYNARFMDSYYAKKIYEQDPFARVDQKGVGKLIDMAVKLGRGTRPDLKVGVCGEHGGDPSSVEFFHRVGLDYVSCSPFRVPIARLAAAQAALKNEK